MRVRTLRPHQNACGDKVAKAEGDEYACADETAKTLIAAKLVEEAKPDSAKKAGK